MATRNAIVDTFIHWIYQLPSHRLCPSLQADGETFGRRSNSERVGDAPNSITCQRSPLVPCGCRINWRSKISSCFCYVDPDLRHFRKIHALRVFTSQWNIFNVDMIIGNIRCLLFPGPAFIVKTYIGVLVTRCLLISNTDSASRFLLYVIT